MKSKIPYFLNFPKNFQEKNISAILKSVENGQNLQLVGLKGSGKSLIFRYLTSSQVIKNKFNIYSLDMNLIPEKNLSSVSDFIIRNLSPLDNQDDSFKKKTIVLVDSFENVEDISDSLLKIFKALTDKYRDYISFIFSVERPIDMKNSYWGKIEYISPLNQNDFDWFYSGLGGDNKSKKRIYSVSVGFMAIVKRLFEIVNSGGDLEEAINNPRINPHLLYQLELMKEGLQGNINYFDVPIYNTFISGIVTNKELTALENKAFQFLIKNSGLIIERDILIKEVWGEHASNDVADHALDQIIHRLKQKIEKDGYKLETIRGRGHRLQR